MLKLSPVEAESDAVNDCELGNVEYFRRMPYISSLQVRDVTRLQSLTSKRQTTYH